MFIINFVESLLSTTQGFCGQDFEYSITPTQFALREFNSSFLRPHLWFVQCIWTPPTLQTVFVAR